MSKKAEKKKAEKIIQDRTFGLKNKNKSKVVQKYVKGVENTVKHYGVSMTKLQADQYEKAKLKKQRQQQDALLHALYNDVNKLKNEEQQQEEDPSTIVCPYFKQGLCQKGKKCIYSHDLTLDRNQQIDLYVDQRTQLIMNAIGGKELTQLSEDQLGKIIGQKQKEMIKGARSDIVCKHFLQAAQKGKYGWNWTCPNNGDRCKYKHCLPPGYRLKKDAGKMEQLQQQINIQEKIDQQRNKLLAENKSSPLVTYQVFLKWKQSKRIQKEAQIVKKKQQDEKKNKIKGQLRTGRQLFAQDPNLFVDDQQAAAQYEIIQEEEVVLQKQTQQGQIQQNQQEYGQQTNENNQNYQNHLQKTYQQQQS